jgi:hypothetical protein
VWSRFIENAAMGSAAAFSIFGERATDLVNRFRTLGTELDNNAASLTRAIDPENKLTGEQLREAMITNVHCYYAGASGNDTKKTTKEGDGPGLQLMDGGPCEIAMNTCSSSASSTHTSQLISCGFGSGSIWRWLGGWWGLGAGLVCLIGVEINYNNAINTCFRNYCDCTNCQN